MTGPVPSVSRNVHYVARGSADGVFPPVCRAAVIAEVDDDGVVTLAVLNPSGIFFGASVLDEGTPCTPGDGGECGGALCSSRSRVYPPGSWHWPERT